MKGSGSFLLFLCFLSTLSIGAADAQPGSAAGSLTKTPTQKTGAAPLWGDLSTGPYAVGFRVIYEFDKTRTWRKTRAYEKDFAPDVNGRPIRISVWYPAAKTAAKPMVFERYIEARGPTEFAQFDAILERHDRGIANLDASADQLPLLLATPVAAVNNAPTAAGHFPLVLHFGGLDDAATMNVSVMAEYLASHGYVVATVPLLGLSDEQAAQSRTPTDIENTVRDMEFALSVLGDKFGIDKTRIGVTGHSLGGIEALVLAMRNANVSAVVGLDGTYGFAGSGMRALTDLYDYAPQRMRAAFMDLRKPAGEQDTVLDMKPVNDLVYSDRTLVTIPRMHHSDFTTFAMIGLQFHVANTPGYVDPTGWTRATAYKGYQEVCDIVLDYFDQHLKGDRGAASRLAADVSRSGGSMQSEPGEPAPPSAGEFVTLLRQKGFDSVTAIVERYRRDVPVETVVNESVFNSLGYNLIAEKRFDDAIGVLRLVTYVYPHSANAADSLGDAYLASNRKAEARAAYQKAVELVADDPRFDPAAKKSFAQDEQRKIEQLNP